MTDSNIFKSIDRKLSAILAVILKLSSKDLDKAGGKKIEFVLSEIGLEPKEIAVLLGKNIGAVHKVIQRSRKSNLN